MAPSSSSSASSGNWVYDVFPSFRGEDVRVTFLSHFLKELDRKLITAFKDSKIERSRSLDPELKQAIKDSRIAVVVFSDNYASSSWCLNELLEIVKCKKEFNQMVIPVFYRLDPTHVRKQTGDFGEAFDKTCKNRTEHEIQSWRQALTDVANLHGFHSRTWGHEAKLIEEIDDDVLGKLNITPSTDFENCVGIEDHIANMSVLLDLESEGVRMVGIWGTSGIGKTTIARALYSRLSRRFQGRIFIDRGFISKSMERYSRSNSDDYGMKLHLQRNFLAEILGKKDMTIEHLGTVKDKLKHWKVLIFIDDLEDQVVLDALADQTHWFGCGSRLIVITKDKQLLRAHEINHVYEVCLPSKELALEMLCRYAFRKSCPPDGLMDLASEVVLLAGNLPLGLNVLGSYLRGRDKDDWKDIMPRLRNGLDGKIEKTLRVSYDGLDNKKDKAIFRHVACLFNGNRVNTIQRLLEPSNLNVNHGINNLVDKSLIHIRRNNVEMQYLLQEMGKEIVRNQSDEPGEREFLMDSKDICDVLEDKTGTKKVLGIAFNIDEADELHIHESAFKGMSNLLYLSIYTNKWGKRNEVRWNLPERFDYFPPKLRLLRLDGYPMRCLPSNFRPENLVKLQMHGGKLEKLWDGVHELSRLNTMDLGECENLKEIPDLSMATNLEILRLKDCLSLVELPSSIQYLNKLKTLDMSRCKNLKTLPTGINLKSLHRLNLDGCSQLSSFPDISTNISYLNLSETAIEEIPYDLHLENLVDFRMCSMKSEILWERVQPLTSLKTMRFPSLTELWLADISRLVELPPSFQNLHKLKNLFITNCKNLETLPTGMNLESLESLNIVGCPQLRSFPNISTNITDLDLSYTGIEEVPWWIQNFSRLFFLKMVGCNNLQCVHLNVSKLKHLELVYFSDCEALSKVNLSDSPSVVAMTTDNLQSNLPDEVSVSFPENYVSKVEFDFAGCLNLDQEALIQQEPVFKQLILSGGEISSYFSHATIGTSLTIPLHDTSPSQPIFRFKACVTVGSEYIPTSGISFGVQACCRFIDRLGNHFESSYQLGDFIAYEKGSLLGIFDCCFPLNKDNGSLVELNYDHVDIEFQLMGDHSWHNIKGCGVRLLEDIPSLENRSCNLNILPHVCKSDSVKPGKT